EFELEVVVGAVDDLDIAEDYVVGSGAHGTTVVTGAFRVYATDAANNPDPDGPGNTTLYGITFLAQDLRAGELVIPAANISFEPAVIDSIAPGQYVSVVVRVNVPYGTYATTYVGNVIATNNTGTTSDVVEVRLTVEPSYDYDISDNTANLVENWMTLSGLPGTIQRGYFVEVNPNSADLNVDPDPFGNADLNNLYWSVGDLLHQTNPLAYIPAANVELLVSNPHSLRSGASLNVGLRVSIPNYQYAGVYTSWVRVIDANTGVGDSFQLKVIVEPVEDIDIVENLITQTVGAGDTLVYLGTFTLVNPDTTWNPDPDGPSNIDLYNLIFSSENLIDITNPNRYISANNIYIRVTGQFGPTPISLANVTQLALGEYATVEVWASIPRGTYASTYRGSLTVLDDDGWPSDAIAIQINVNPYYDLDISDNEAGLVGNVMRLSGVMGSVQRGYFRMVNPNSAELNVDPDQFGNADFSGFTVSVETLRYVPYGGEEVLYYIPPSAVSVALPSGLVSGGSYNALVTVNVPYNTFAGLYRGVVTVTGVPGSPGTPADNFVLEVVVGPVDYLDIDSVAVHGVGDHGSIVTTTSFRVYSRDGQGYGNTTLYGVSFIVSDLVAGNRVIPASNVSVVPALIESIPPGSYRTAVVRVNVPYGTYATTYSGLVTAINNTGSTSDTVRVFVTVNPSYDLDIADNIANLVRNTMTLQLIPNTQASGQFLLVNPDRNENNYDPDPFGNSNLTGIRYRVSEVLTSPDGYTLSGSAITFTNNPTNLAWGASQYVTVTVNIEPSQPYATYYGTVTVYDSINEATVISDQFTLEVIVRPRDAFSLADTIYLTGHAGEFATTEFFVKNIGNKTIDRIELFPMTDLVSAGGVMIRKERIQFAPPVIIDSIQIGDSVEVSLRVEIPQGVLPTRYTAKAKAMQQHGDPAKNFVIVLDVQYRPDIDEGIVVSENPVLSNYVDIGYIGEPGQPVKLTIMNMAAEIVHTKELTVDPGTNSGVYRWYLKNDKEQNVAPGIYVIITQFTTTENEQPVEKVFRKKILIVR
ncbi:MAG: hypothetical protein ABIK73_02700, partial [candidate division WOR-3 bacterium]